MRLSRVYKKYPETKSLILNRMEAQDYDDYDCDAYDMLLYKLERYLLEMQDISKIQEILDNFEELMKVLKDKLGGKYYSDRLDEIEYEIEKIIEKGGLTDEFKKRIGSYNNIPIGNMDCKDYYKLLLEINRVLGLDISLEDFATVILLNKEYKESGIIVNLRAEDIPALSSLSNEKLDIALKNWDSDYQKLIDKMHENISILSKGYKNALEYLLNEYIDLDETKKKYFIEYFNIIGYHEKDPMIDTAEKIRNIDTTLFESIEKNPSGFSDFFRSVVIKNFDERYFEEIEDNETLEIIELWNCMWNCMWNCIKRNNGAEAKNVLKRSRSKFNGIN